MNKITIIALSLLAFGSQAQGMYTKKGREIMTNQKAHKAALVAHMPANKAKIVLVPVSKPAPACSKEEYYNVRLPLINASKEAKNKAKAFRAAEQSHPVVQQRTAVGKTVATLAPLAALGALVAYDQGLLRNGALANAVQSIDMVRVAALFKNSVINPALKGARLAMGYANPAIWSAKQFAKENAEYAPVAGLSAYIIAKNHVKMKKDARELAAEETGYEQLAQRAADANELYLNGKTPYNAKNLEVKVVGIKREGNTFALDDKH